jgi:hypothetical protein
LDSIALTIAVIRLYRIDESSSWWLLKNDDSWARGRHARRHGWHEEAC